MKIQRHELMSWLGDAAKAMTAEQIDEFAQAADDISDRYSDDDDSFEESNAALIAAHRTIMGEDIVDELVRKRVTGQARLNVAMAGLRQVAVMRAGILGPETEAGFARRASVDRMTVRHWLGKQ